MNMKPRTRHLIVTACFIIAFIEAGIATVAIFHHDTQGFLIGIGFVLMDIGGALYLLQDFKRQLLMRKA